jgi:hypothetical protein
MLSYLYVYKNTLGLSSLIIVNFLNVISLKYFKTLQFGDIILL